ncbi:MAG: phage tail tape measure protein [Spirochaetota bacterium]
MSQFTASVKLAFVDAFSAKAQQVKANFGGVKTSIENMSKVNPVFTEFAANMSLVAGQASNLAQGIQSRLAVPAELAENFEAAGARVTTVLTAQNAIQGDTAKSLETLKAAAVNNAAGMAQAGRLSAMAAEEYLNSSFTMLSSGLNAKQAMAATEQSALLAKATGDNVTVAASALVGVFNNFGEKTGNARAEMTKLSDVMATTQAYYAFEDLKGYSDGLANVAGTAIAMKAPFEQISPLIGQLNTNMIKGPVAGTALKSMMSQLGNASAKLGFDIARTAGGSLDLIATLENIQATGAGGAALIKAFGTEAGPAVGILTENLEGVKSGFEAIQNGAGATLGGAEKAADSLQSSIEALNLAKDALNQKLGGGANTVRSWGVSIQSTGVYLGNLLSKVPGVGEGMLSVAGGMGQVASVAVGATAGFFQFSSGIASTMVMAQQLGGVKSLITNSLGAVRTTVGLVTGGVWNLGKKAVVSGWQMAVSFGQRSLGALKMAGSAVAGFGKKAVFAFAKAAVGAWSLAAAHLAAFWPIYAIAAGIAAVIAVGVLLYKNWDSVKAFGATVWNGFTSGIKTAWDWLSGVLNNPLIAAAGVVFAPFIAVPALIVKHWGKIKEFFAGLFGGIKAGWDKVSGFFTKVFGSGKAQSETMAQGMVAGTPKVEQAAYNMAYTADQYYPHSNAKKGPLSRLSQSGEALVDTVQKGAEKRKLDLNKPLTAQFHSNNGAVTLSEKGTKSCSVHIENLTVQAEDVQNMVDFVRMLQQVGGNVA